MLLLTLLLASVAFAKEVIRGTPTGWTKLEDVVDPKQKVAFRLALPQRNVDVLAAETMKRANPEDPMYSQWFTPTEVLDLIAPDPKRVEVVVNWARSVGLSADGSRRDIVLCEGSVAQVEKALQTRFAYWHHAKSNTKHLRTLAYTIPDDVHEHIELVAGITEFWPRPQKPKLTNEQRKRNDVSTGYIIPDVLRKLYNIPNDVNARKLSLGSSICVAEFQDDASYAPSDLTYFDKQTGEDRSHVTHKVGPFSPSQPDAESQLDIEYASTLSLNSTYWFWTVTGWMMEFSNDLFSNPGPLVVSMSWGWPEDAQCQVANCNGITAHQYVSRVDTEWLKITSTGVSLLAASGDQGAPGDNHGDACDGISDIYPGASTWITSVGATMLAKSTSPTSKGPPACANNPPGCATSQKEVVCSIQEALITSGGGFARYEPMPAYQKTVVDAYLAKAPKLPKGHYDPKNRAFPDVSAIGHAELIGYQGGMTQVDGTSCSSPIVASMVALLNGNRLNAKKKPLGYLNPMLYAAHAKNAAIFKDITIGNNDCSENCCGNLGFEAIAGWDASTGLGAIYYDKLLAYVKTLP